MALGWTMLLTVLVLEDILIGELDLEEDGSLDQEVVRLGLGLEDLIGDLVLEDALGSNLDLEDVVGRRF